MRVAGQLTVWGTEQEVRGLEITPVAQVQQHVLVDRTDPVAVGHCVDEGGHLGGLACREPSPLGNLSGHRCHRLLCTLCSGVITRGTSSL